MGNGECSWEKPEGLGLMEEQRVWVYFYIITGLLNIIATGNIGMLINTQEKGDVELLYNVETSLSKVKDEFRLVHNYFKYT